MREQKIVDNLRLHMDNFPKISIITPNFNGSLYLEETILSVLGQNYPNLEYIIIDGGSTDGSVDIIKKYEKYLHWWVTEPDNGMYEAIQKGFEYCSGEIMAWINSDDMYHRNALFSVAEIFSSFKSVNWLLGANTNYDEYNRTINVKPSRQFTKLDFYNHDFKWIQQESVFWRKILWEKVGSRLNTQLKYAGDFELWLRFFQHDHLYLTNALIGGFRMSRANQLSSVHMDEYLQEVHMSISKFELSKTERQILLNYRKCLLLESFLKKIKFIKTDWIIYRYRAKYFSGPPLIGFDKNKMKFVFST